MTAATATIDDDTLVSQPETKKLYMSRRSALRLVKTPRYPIYGPAGQKAGERPGEIVPFVEGVFRCPPTGKVTLEDGRDADAAEIVEWLESHRLKGDIEEGFWAVDPVAPAPSPLEIETMMEAAHALDDVTLERMIEQEQQGWQREDILRIARGAVDRIKKTKEEARAAAEAEAKPEPKAKGTTKG